jgi:hypothetical protein
VIEASRRTQNNKLAFFTALLYADMPWWQAAKQETQRGSAFPTESNANRQEMDEERREVIQTSPKIF